MGAALGMLVVGLAACSGDDEDSSAPSAIETPGERAGPPGDASSGDEAAAEEAPAATSAASDTTAASDATADTSTGSVSSGGATAPATQRLMIVDVTVVLEVDDVATVLPQVIEVAGAHGGLVYGSDVELGDPLTATGEVVVKVPPAEVEAAISDITSLGRLTGRFQGTDDVTDTVTDVETRIINQQQSVDRVQAMLAEADDLGEVVMLEGELTARQLVLEQLLAQQRNLRNATAMATLTVQLTTAPPVTDEVEAEPLSFDLGLDDRSVSDAFAEGGRAFLTAGTAVLIFVGYAAPFLATLGVVAVVVRLVTRRRAPRSRSVAPPLPPAPDGDPRTTAPDSAGVARS